MRHTWFRQKIICEKVGKGQEAQTEAQISLEDMFERRNKKYMSRGESSCDGNLLRLSP
jgi:hypothetical protein